MSDLTVKELGRKMAKKAISQIKQDTLLVEDLTFESKTELRAWFVDYVADGDRIPATFWAEVKKGAAEEFEAFFIYIRSKRQKGEEYEEDI